MNIMRRISGLEHRNGRVIARWNHGTYHSLNTEELYLLSRGIKNFIDYVHPSTTLLKCDL